VTGRYPVPYRDETAARRAALASTLLLSAALAVPAWPLVLATLATLAAAWLCGMHPARVLRAAAWSTPVAGVYLEVAAVQDRTWSALAARPVADWHRASLLLIHGHPVPALLLTAPLAVPAGLAAGAGLWAWMSHAYAHGLIGATGLAPSVFEARQWKRAARAARRASRAPGLVPLAGRHGVGVGPVIRVTGRRWARVLAIPAAEFSRHMVIVGASGTGKTTLMIRLWAGWYAATRRAAARDQAPPPLLCALDCKGGRDARAKAAQTAAALQAAGAARVGIWPDQAALSMWTLPPRDLAVLLHQLIEHGDGAARYYADMNQAVIFLAILAPQGPPRRTAEFLDRLDPAWLEAAYADRMPAALPAIRAARPHVGDIRMRYASVLSRLGPALDQPGQLSDYDAWYFILEGTSEPSVAEAQAMAITELIARAATSTTGPERAILLAADDYSAVSRRVPLSNLYERGRSLGLGVMVSAQSWHGLGADDDERYRITATADGGIFLLRTPHPEPLVALAGTRRILETARKLLGPVTGDEGTSRVQHTWVVDPDRIRQLKTGQACHIQAGTAAWAHVTPAPATNAAPLTRPPARPTAIPAARPRRDGTQPPQLPPAPRKHPAGHPPGHPSAQ
jgi:hypothetical protein